MSELSKYLVEQILLDEDAGDINKIVVVYSGRFQPFHKGHYGVYKHLTDKFGKDAVYIATSNKVAPPKSPFNFEEKKEIMTSMFPIPKENIVEVKSPYSPKEIVEKYDPKTTALVVVVSEKDKERLTQGSYYTPLEEVPWVGYEDGGYVYVVPVMGDNISATQVRNGLSIGNDEQLKRNFIKYYDTFNQSVFDLITSKVGGIEISKETIEEWMINSSLLNESSATSTGQDDDGPTFMFPNYDVFSMVSAKRAKKIGYEVVNMIMSKELEDYYEHPTYPKGPAQAVSYFPAGVLGKMTPNNQFDIYSNKAYDKWYAHMTRKATLAGYELVFTQLEREIARKLKAMSGKDAKGDAAFKNKMNSQLNEAITIPVEVGDTILTGRFKNKKVVVKSIGKDEHGMPTINGKKVVTFRLMKEGFVAELEENLLVEKEILTNFKNLGIARKDMPQIKSSDMDDYKKHLKKNGIKYRVGKMPVKALNLTQKEINLDKVQDLMSTEISNLAKPVIISSDRYILDGHHRVVALYGLGPNNKINTVQVSLPIKELLKFTHDFSGSTTKDIDEVVSLTEATDTLKLNIPSDIKKIHKGFKKAGKKLYVVGGAVRDAILGKNPKDFDLATDAKPEETLQIAKDMGFNTAEVGKSFGVVIVGGHEIATFRKDIGKGRRPDAVDYTDIEGDVKRRDLTINALFYDLDRKEIVDLVGGIEDLKKNKIRTVGKAEERFDEDPLRKLRALRFQARLGGTMDASLMIALKKDPSLNGVSSERIRDEFIKSIKSAKSPSKYMEMNDKIGFTKLILPGLKVSKPYPDENNHELFLAWVLRDNDVSTLGKTLNKLNYTGDEVKNIVFLISLKKFSPENIVAYKKAQSRTSLSDEEIIEYGKKIGKDMKKFVSFNLSVSGNDAPDGTKGKEIGNWINQQEKEKYMKNEDINEIVNEAVNEAVKQTINELAEMSKADLKAVEKFADKELAPYDVEFSNHFFDRLNDPRNGEPISKDELMAFFQRLAYKKGALKSFLSRYDQVVAKSRRTNLNIPLLKTSSELLAKTIMRKKNFSTSTPTLNVEDKISGGLADNMSLKDIAEKHGVSLEQITNEFKKGYKVEREHTDDTNVAKEIAMDHLAEMPDYYSKLATIEEGDNRELELKMVKLLNKALKMMPNSPKQLEVRKEIEKLRNQLK